MQLEHAKAAANHQLPTKGSRSLATATHNAANTSATESVTSQTQGHLFVEDALVENVPQSHQTLPSRRVLRQAPWASSGRPIQASKSHSLWNPINYSATLSLPATAVPSDVTAGSPLEGHALGDSSIIKAAPLGRNDLSNQDNPEVDSRAFGKLPHPRSKAARSRQGEPLSRIRSSTLPQRLSQARSAMTPTHSQHSLHSDTPSKRPPTPAKDLEYGISRPPPQPSRASTPRHSQQASSTKSDLAWGPSHPCYPHPNPHIPLTSPLHDTTRIIRIPRDWTIEGDLAPTFSHTYPEVLDPWVSESDFRTLIKSVNEGLIAAFTPYGWRAWVDTILGIATGWLYEDLGFSRVKKGARDVELLIEEWNGQRKMGLDKEDEDLVKAIPLRRTGYLCLDIQIPDPHVGVVDDEGEREGTADGSGEQAKV